MRIPVVIETAEFERRGLPRPIADVDGRLRPVPWSQDKSWGVLHVDRGSECSAESLCLVCGEHVLNGKVLVTVKNVRLGTTIPKLFTFESLDDLLVVDGGPLHNRCAALTGAHCVTVREGLKSDPAVYVWRDYLDDRPVID